jgi:hypothetical protein
MIDMHDFKGHCSQLYTEQCECGKEFRVSTQEDRYPEYRTDIYIMCDCGKSVNFNLPVN